LLVEHGAEVSAKDKRGSTPLHRAAEHNRIDLARFLVEHGADMSAKDEHGSTPLHRASQRPSSMSLFQHHRPMVVQFLVEHGADVSAQDERGLTPLDLASESGLVELVLFFNEHHGDAIAQDWPQN
jgi:ankyrin repeat protein